MLTVKVLPDAQAQLLSKLPPGLLLRMSLSTNNYLEHKIKDTISRFAPFV